MSFLSRTVSQAMNAANSAGVPGDTSPLNRCCRSVSDRRALQIGPDDQRTRIRRLEIGDGGIEIEQPDVTHNQSPNVRLLRDAPHDRGRRMKGAPDRIGSTGRYREMHNQHIGVSSEIDKFRIGAVLI